MKTLTLIIAFASVAAGLGAHSAARADDAAAQKSASSAQATAGSANEGGAGRTLQISGYLQTRWTVNGKSESSFPQGQPAKNGAYNGNYAQGGNSDSFAVRRARLKITGQITQNTRYVAQVDFSGAFSSSNQQVTARDANICYTFGDGSSRYPTLTFGQFATPFGYALPGSNAASLTPERPLAFSEARYGLFASQDFDKGVELSCGLGRIVHGAPLRFTAAFINGNGRASDNTDRRIDQVYRLAFESPTSVISAGLSYYNGQLPGSGAGASYLPRKKQLFGADAQITLPAGLFVNGEYVSGQYEQRTEFGYSAGAGFALSPTTAYAPGNKIAGWYAQSGWIFARRGPHPLTIFASCDVLRRASGGPGASDSFTDANTGCGVLCNLDKATRLRLYYVKPTKVAHDPAAPEAPLKIGQALAEVQVKF